MSSNPFPFGRWNRPSLTTPSKILKPSNEKPATAPHFLKQPPSPVPVQSPPDGIHSFSLFPYWMMTNDTVFLRPTHYNSSAFPTIFYLSLFIIWFWFCLVVIDIFDGKLRKESKIRTTLTWLATWLPKSARPRKRVTDMTHEACVDVGIHTQTHTHTICRLMNGRVMMPTGFSLDWRIENGTRRRS